MDTQSDEEMRKFIKSLPKAELHLHIEGTLEADLMIRLAKKNNIQIPYADVEKVKQAYDFDGLESFIKVYSQASNVLVTEEDFFQLTWEYLVRAKQDGVVHVEIFFDPQTHEKRGISFETVINGISRALAKGKDELNITNGLIMSFLRDLSEQEAFATYERALPYKNMIVAVGIDNPQLGNPPKKFQRLFERARNDGLLAVAHAGEVGPPQYIWDSLNILKVKRIDHGIRCLEDEKLLEHLKEAKIPLTVCPLSNLRLKCIDNVGELKKLIDAGLTVTINSDDPGFFGGYLAENYYECYKEMKLSKKDLIILANNSLTSSFLSEEAKASHLTPLPA